MQTYYSNGSRFYKTPDGDKPSVTSIISIKDKGEGLKQWAINQTVLRCQDYIKRNEKLIREGKITTDDLIREVQNAKYAHKDAMKEAGNIGNAVHDAIEVFLKKGEMPKFKVGTPEYNGFIAFLVWKKKNNFESINIEMPIYSDKGFGGRIDWIAKLNDKKYILDFKTSNNFFDTHALQLSAYAYAYEERTGEEIEGIGIIRLDKNDGHAEFKDYTIGREEYFMQFMCLLKAWETDQLIKNKENDLVIESYNE